MSLFERVRRAWLLYHLADPAYAFLFDPPPPGEWVALDCETTGLNVRSDEIIAIGAVRIAGNRILASERLELLAVARRLAGRSGLDPESCCGLELRSSRGYHPYKGGLRLWDGEQLQALEQRSALVDTLARSQETAWLIHPHQVSQALAQECSRRRQGSGTHRQDGVPAA